MRFFPVFRLLRMLPIILCLSLALLATLLLVGCGSASSGTISTVAGSGGGGGYSGDGGAATSAVLNLTRAVVLDSSGNMYIADQGNNVIRKVTVSTGVITTLAGNGTGGYSGDHGPATSAMLNVPFCVAIDPSGNLYIADLNNHVIRKVAASSGVITTVAGNGTLGYAGDNGPATSATLNAPQGVAVDSSGNIYIADYGSSVIRKVTASTGIITTVAGNGDYGYSGDTGPAANATLHNPSSVAVDSSGNFYIADVSNMVIRKVTASTGVITTVAGNGAYGYTGDNGLATSAALFEPRGVMVDSSGDLFIADTSNNVIREVTASNGVITTVAGNGTAGYSGDKGPATSALLDAPNGVAVDSSGSLYIADTINNAIRKVIF